MQYVKILLSFGQQDIHTDIQLNSLRLTTYYPFQPDRHKYLCSVDLDETVRNEPSHQEVQ